MLRVIGEKGGNVPRLWSWANVPQVPFSPMEDRKSNVGSCETLLIPAPKHSASLSDGKLGLEPSQYPSAQQRGGPLVLYEAELY